MLTFFLLVMAQSSVILPTVAEDTPNKPIWAWECVENTNCVKKTYSSLKEPLSYHACHLVCGNSVLWPYPTGQVIIDKNFTSINPHSVTFEYSLPQKGDNSGVRKFFKMVEHLFKNGIAAQIPNKKRLVYARTLLVNIFLEDTSSIQITQDTNESYSLEVQPVGSAALNANIRANNFFGARHGLETLRQLIVYDSFSNSLIMPYNVNITDAPTYQYRGILVDTSRHFISVSVIKKTIEAMSANKLNTFHWHITDSHSFPFSSKTYPQFTAYGAYSESEIYNERDMKYIVEYGLIHGVRVLPEFDGPAHIGEGWQWTPENTTVCYRKEPWRMYCTQPPCGQLNPTSDNLYPILNGIYKDMTTLFPSDLFHMGGDEVNLNCWNSSDNIVENMAKMGLGRSYDDFHSLWSMFQKKAVSELDSVTTKPKKVIIWTSTLTADNIDKYIDKNRYIIQVWTKGNSTMISNLIKKGYSVIFSNYNALYLDCGFANYAYNANNWCSPYITWQTVYENHPKKILDSLNLDWAAYKNLVLGSEATLWTETIDDSSASNRIWPRGAAMAETLWTASGGTWLAARNRMNYNRGRMVSREFLPDTIQPEWCDQNEGLCVLS